MARKELRQVNTVMNRAQIVELGSAVCDKLDMSESRYSPYNRYFLTKNAARACFSL